MASPLSVNRHATSRKHSIGISFHCSRKTLDNCQHALKCHFPLLDCCSSLLLEEALLRHILLPYRSITSIISMSPNTHVLLKRLDKLPIPKRKVTPSKVTIHHRKVTPSKVTIHNWPTSMRAPTLALPPPPNVTERMADFPKSGLMEMGDPERAALTNLPIHQCVRVLGGKSGDYHLSSASCRYSAPH